MNPAIGGIYVVDIDPDNYIIGNGFPKPISLTVIKYEYRDSSSAGGIAITSEGQLYFLYFNRSTSFSIPNFCNKEYYYDSL